MSREMDLSDFDIMDFLLADENSNHIERELANTINCSVGHNDTEAFSNDTGNSSQNNDIRNSNVENEIPRHDRQMESMEIFPIEINMRISRGMDFLMSMMHSQINRAISSAISYRYT